MRKFLITNNNRFTGQAEIVYNSRGILCIIDCSDTDMDEQTVHDFKRAVPVNVDRLSEAFKAPTVILESNYEVSFDKFYKDYPLKRNRFKAEKQWLKLTETERVMAWHSLSGYKKYLAKFEWQNPMMADTYLSRKEFQTEWHKLKK